MQLNAEKTALLLRWLLAGVFVFSAIAKLLGAGLFEIALVEQGLAATRAQAAYPARLLIAWEMFLGLALLLPFYLKRFTLPLVITTLAAFIFLQIFQLISGTPTQDCGCFGKFLPMSSLEALLKNLVLLGLALSAYRMTSMEKRSALVPVSLAALCFTAVWFVAPVRHDYEGSFAKYTQFTQAGRVDLTSGEILVAVFNAECEHCQAAARELEALAEQGAPLPPIYVLMLAENTATATAFSEKTNTHYPYHLISENEFFDLIGNTPPRVYWLRQGQIQARWDTAITENIRATFKPRTAATLSPAGADMRN